MKEVIGLCLVAALFCGCSQLGFIESVNPATGETELSWSAESAQKTIEKVDSALDSVASATGQQTNPFYLAATAALSLVSGALGIATKVQSSQKNKVLTALKETTLKAADLIRNDGGDVAKLVSAVKQIQNETGTRGMVQKSLSSKENISNTDAR